MPESVKEAWDKWICSSVEEDVIDTPEKEFQPTLGTEVISLQL